MRGVREGESQGESIIDNGINARDKGEETFQMLPTEEESIMKADSSKVIHST